MLPATSLVAALMLPQLFVGPAAASAPAPATPPVVKTAAACRYPAQAINLTNWKITLPIGSPGSPQEVKQPQLATYNRSPYFTVNSSCTTVQFRAPVNGVTTSGSSYPRSELREMTNNGRSNANWSSTAGTHSLRVQMAFTALPAVKPHVVGAQIHNGNDDVTAFRLQGTNLYVTDGDNSTFKLVTNNYQVGTRFEARYEVSGGMVRVYYNGTLQATLPRVFTGYFKTGAYTQANCTNSSPCSSTNFGQVSIYSLNLSHSLTSARGITGLVAGAPGLAAGVTG